MTMNIPTTELKQPLAESKMESYYLATYGCQMNVYDSNMIAQMLEKRGMVQTEEANQADLIVVNTCAIRGGAEDKAYARISSMRHFKKKNPELKIAVIGCMAQNHGEKIPVSLSHVDFVVGPDNYKELENQLFESSKGNKAKILTEINGFENYEGMLAKLDSKVSAFVSIMRGCNKHCSYCIVPFVRGKERSRDPDEVEEEVRRAVLEGIPEVTLLGQTVNSYRRKTDKGLVTFANLLERLSQIEGLKRIRFTSPHPRHFTPDVIDVMAKYPNICPHVHMPLQSGSDKMLAKMRRQYDRAEFLNIIQQLREKIPGIGLTTDIITGFVGESEQDYQDTLSLVKEIRFDHAFMFSYSPREGTEAFAEPETLSQEEKSQRLSGLIDIQNQITIENLDNMLGKEEEILLEGPSHRNKSEWIGKTGSFKKVLVPHEEGFFPGHFVQVKITERRGMTLAGKVIS